MKAFTTFLALPAAGSFLTGEIGPAKGALLIVGGGKVTSEISDAFFSLAGGKDAEIVIIPAADGVTENGTAKYDDACLAKTFRGAAGATHLTILHTLDRTVADSPDFVFPLRSARAVWFVGGRQDYRLVYGSRRRVR